MAVTEMGFKQAQGEMRAMLKALRGFEAVDAVLRAAANAGVAQVNAEKKLVGLLSEIEGLETSLAAARAQATKEQNVAAVELERARDAHYAREAKFKNEAEETAQRRERVANEAMTASELIGKQLKADCVGLEEKREGLVKAITRAQADWDAMRKRMGVGDASC